MAAKLRKREEIPAQYKWDLSHIYPDDAAWEAALADVLASGKKFAAWEGKVAENPRQAIREYFDLNQQAEPVFSYAFLRGETDNGDPVAQGLRARASQMGVQLSTAMSFFEPELLSLDDALLAEIAADPAMADYDAFLRNLIRQKPHTLPAEQEKLLAMMGQVAQAPNHIFGMLTDVDMSFPPVQMPDGTTAELTEGTYSQFIRSDSRDVRKSAFDGIMNTYGSFGNTIAATYNGSVQNDVFQARARHYATARDARMEPLEIPTSVYDNLISEVHAAIPVLNEYLALRKALMGLDELHMYDLYTPMVKDFHMELSYDKAFDLVLEGLKPMGEDYLAKLREARVGGWIDVYPSKGKSSGAFSSGNLRDVHPYVLLNHKNNLDCQFTLAHEMGHALHSYHSCKYQPISTCDYVIFVAEVASTCNEVLLMRHLLSKTTDKKQRAYLINHFLDQFKGTVYRQTMFAEFELAMGKMAENGEALTADALCRKYHELNKLYFGPDMISDDQIALEWARIPHFFYNYYVFQYATGFSAAVAIANRILKEGAPAVADYKKFLSGGSSTDPLSLLKIAGVDMSSPEPVNSALALFGELVDELAELL